MKVFISMPMNGKSEEETKAEYEENKKTVLKLFPMAEVKFSIFHLKGDRSAIHYLARSIEFLDDADIVFMAKGWEKARGCVIEHEVAQRYGKMIIEDGNVE